MRHSQSNSIFQDQESYNLELHWIWIVGGHEVTTENHLFIKLLCKIITFEKVTICLHFFFLMHVFFSYNYSIGTREQ